jgi:hypothetical protein
MVDGLVYMYENKNNETCWNCSKKGEEELGRMTEGVI